MRIASLFTHVKLVLSALVLYAYCGVVCLFRIRLDIIRVLSSIRIFLSAFYPPSAFSYPRFILHPHFLIRVLSSIRIFSSAFYPPSAFSHPRFILHPHFLIRVLSSIRIFSSVFSHPHPYPYPRFIPTLLKLVKLPSLVAKYCKIRKIYACEVSKFSLKGEWSISVLHVIATSYCNKQK